MNLFSRKPKHLEPRQALEIIRYAAKPLSNVGELPDAPHLTSLDETTRANLLRRLYLDIEKHAVKRPDAPWENERMLRIDIAKRFKVAKLVPDGFTVLFLPRWGQMFWLFQAMLHGLWKRAEWEEERVMALLAEVATGTPLLEVRTFSSAGWQSAYHAFADFSDEVREAKVIDAFKRLIDKSFREFVTEQGDSQARIALEEVGRGLNEDFRMLDVIAEVMQSLPEGVLAEERITYSSKEELQETVRQQMQELRGKNMALIAEARQLHETIQRLEESRDHAEAMAKAQQDFVQVVMHQFRTPLAALRWQAEALSEFVKDHPEFEDLITMGQVIRERSSFLVGQLENIFDLLALQSGDYGFSPAVFDVGRELDMLCQEFIKDAELKQVALTCSSGDAVTIQVDPDAIHRVLRIIIINAINYSSEGGSISVSHEVVKRGDEVGEVRVHVKDEGIGIRPDERPKLFTKFFRGKNAIRKVADGAGIGLFISKRIIELHGGKMWADSRGEGEGAMFSFSLPIDSALTQSSNERSVPQSAGLSRVPPSSPSLTPVTPPQTVPSGTPTPPLVPEPVEPSSSGQTRSIQPEPKAPAPPPQEVPTELKPEPVPPPPEPGSSSQTRSTQPEPPESPPPTPSSPDEPQPPPAKKPFKSIGERVREMTDTEVGDELPPTEKAPAKEDKQKPSDPDLLLGS